MTCTQWQEQIALYVDGELSSADQEAFRSHLQSCAACSARALAASENKLAVRTAAANRYEVPEALRWRVSQIASGAPKAAVHQSSAAAPSPSRWKGLRMAAMSVAAILAVVVSAVMITNQRAHQQALGEFADLHVSTLASANPVEVVSTDRHTVKPWFQGRIPFAFDLPELGSTPFTLIGGRLAYVHQEPAAQLLFGYQKHVVSVFVLRDTSTVPLESGADHSSSFHLQSWRQNGLRYVVIGDVNPDAIRQLSDLLQHAQ